MNRSVRRGHNQTEPKPTHRRAVALVRAASARQRKPWSSAGTSSDGQRTRATCLTHPPLRPRPTKQPRAAFEPLRLRSRLHPETHVFSSHDSADLLPNCSEPDRTSWDHPARPIDLAPADKGECDAGEPGRTEPDESHPAENRKVGGSIPSLPTTTIQVTSLAHPTSP
jgi:hypothetical protein